MTSNLLRVCVCMCVYVCVCHHLVKNSVVAAVFNVVCRDDTIVLSFFDKNARLVDGDHCHVPPSIQINNKLHYQHRMHAHNHKKSNTTKDNNNNKRHANAVISLGNQKHQRQ